MLTIGRGQHGSTYGGNPVAARVAIASLQVKLASGWSCCGLGFGARTRHDWCHTVAHNPVAARVAIASLQVGLLKTLCEVLQHAMVKVATQWRHAWPLPRCR
jgi:adenosylmethionine-8-amino-7-oxononanoate aminotransferase